MTTKLNAHQISSARQSSDACHEKHQVARLMLETIALVEHTLATWTDLDEVEAEDRRYAMARLDSAKSYVLCMGAHNLIASINLEKTANDLEQAAEILEALEDEEETKDPSGDKIPF